MTGPKLRKPAAIKLKVRHSPALPISQSSSYRPFWFREKVWAKW
jgi:hypothetical protein